jgi:hypothetical protein
MCEIAFALELYQRLHSTLPPAYSTDEQGNPLHSWRVLILPYVRSRKHIDVYEKIRLDEPWDSDWNKQFHVFDHGGSIIIGNEAPFMFNCRCTMPPFDERLGGGSVTDENGKIHYSYTSNYYMVIDESGKVVPECGILFAEREKEYNWMNPNHEIRLVDTKDGVNSNRDGITSGHGFFLGKKGANICTFEFEVKRVAE